jgi:LmbE family N-acetylglucosaminyl deacetylase
MIYKNLIIAPHADDEVLGCGNFMLKNKCDVLIMGVSSYVNFKGDYILASDKMKEIAACHKFLGVGETFIFSEKEGHLDSLPEYEIVTYLDDLLKSNYDRIFLPYPSRHIDHRVTYNAVMAALRLREGKPQEKEVYLYEYPFVQTTDALTSGGVYLPCTLLELEQKIDAFMFYVTQTKQKPSPLNPDGIKTLAKMRGMEMGFDYAEKYYLHSYIL